MLPSEIAQTHSPPPWRSHNAAPGHSTAQCPSMVVRATTYGRAELLQACCHVLVRFGPPATGQPVAIFVGGPAGRGHRRACRRAATADLVLYRLFTQGPKEEALVCLETLLRKSKAHNPLDALGSTTHYLASRQADFLPVVTCRWLLTGDRTLCAAARYLITSTGNQKFTFDFDAGNRGWPSDTHALPGAQGHWLAHAPWDRTRILFGLLAARRKRGHR